jgi:hypothetical protein
VASAALACDGKGAGGSFDGAVILPEPGLTVSPTAFQFPQVDIGNISGPVLFTVENLDGRPSAPLFFQMEGMSAREFAVVATDCGPPLPPAGRCSFQVVLEPMFPGIKIATLTVAAVAAGMSASFRVLLSGDTPPKQDAGVLDAPSDRGRARSVEESLLWVVPAEFSFASTPVGAESEPATFMVSNQGLGWTTGPVKRGLEGPSAHEFIPFSTCEQKALKPVEVCRINLVFRPIVPGKKSVQLIVSAQPGGTFAVNVFALGVLLPTGLEMLPTFFDFPAVAVPGPGNLVPKAASTSFVVINAGSVRVGPLSAGLTGPDAADFEVATSTCAELEPQASCPVTVLFAPRNAGRKTASLAIGIANSPRLLARLSGVGLP